MRSWAYAVVVAYSVAAACTGAEGTVLRATPSDGGPEAVAPDGGSAALLRLVHLAPQVAEHVDLCVEPYDGSFGEPSFRHRGAPAGGLAFDEASDYLTLSPGVYVLRVVSAGSSSCTAVAPLAPDLTMSAGAGSAQTIAFLQVVDQPDGSALRLLLEPFQDLQAADGGGAAARLINGCAGIPMVQLGLDGDAGFVPLGNPVPAGRSGRYVDVSPGTATFGLRVELGLVRPLSPELLPPNATTSIFASGSPSPNVSMTWYGLVCADQQFDAGLTSCQSSTFQGP